MNWLRSLVWRLRAFNRTEQIHNELESELAFHREMRRDELLARGYTLEEAEQESLRQFGKVQRWHEAGFDLRGGGWLEYLRQDVVVAMRLMRKDPLRSLTLIAVLTAGAGVSAAGFSLLHSVLWQPLPFASPDRLVVLHQAGKGHEGGASYPHFLDWKSGARAFTKMGVFGQSQSILRDSAGVESVQSAVVSASTLSLLQVQPLRGRLFREEEDRRTANSDGARPLLISEQLWHSRYNADEQILGKSVILDGLTYQVIGVLPTDQSFPVSNTPPAVWTTVAAYGEPTVFEGTVLVSRGFQAFDGVLARLKPGITVAAARSEMERVAANVSHDHPKMTDLEGIVLRPALDDLVENVRPLLLLFFGVGFAVLLVACLNAGTLLSVGSVARQREWAIRTSLGAPKTRLAAQLITEFAVLGLCSIPLALVLGQLAIVLFRQLAPPATPRLGEIHLTFAAAAYCCAISFGSAAIAGWLPLLTSLRTNVAGALKANSRSASAGTPGLRIGSLLVTSQIAISMVLCCSAALLTSSFAHILNTPRGFEARSVFTAGIDLPSGSYSKAPEIRRFFRELQRRLEGSPAVQSVALAQQLPLSGESNSTTVRLTTDAPAVAMGQSTGLRFINPSYFTVLRIPQVSGRPLSDNDDEHHPPVALVNQAFVRRYLSAHRAEGTSLVLGWGSARSVVVVGTVGDVKYRAMDVSGQPEVYIPAAQFPVSGMHVLVRTSNPAMAAEAIRSAVRILDPQIPVLRMRTLEGYLTLATASQRFLMAAINALAACTLAIAAVGMFGMLSYATQRRRLEFGIRLALGSRPGQILGLVFRQGFLLVFSGMIAGLVLCAAAGRLLSAWLYQTSTWEPVSLVVAASTLALVAAFACLIPARWASRTNPAEMIRAE